MASKRQHLYSGEITVKWTDLNPQQWKFVTSRAPFLCGSGGMGSGKTVALVRRAILLSIKSPLFGDLEGNVGLIGRYGMNDFLKTTYIELKRWLPQAWIKTEDKSLGLIELINGSRIYITHYDDLDHILSFNLGWAAIDQMEQVSEEVFNELSLHRVRMKALIKYDSMGRLINPEFDDDGNCISTDPAVKVAALTYHSVFGVCNPKQANRWILKKFIKNAELKDSKDPELRKLHDPEFELTYIPTTENKRYLPKGYIDRQKRLLSTRAFERDVEGKWQKFEGLVAEDFTRDNVNSLNIIPPPDWKIIVSIDHGGSGTPQKNNATNIKAVTFIAYRRRGGEWPEAIVYDSLYLGGHTIQSCVRCIDERLKMHQQARINNYRWYKSTDAYPPVEMWRCDPAMLKGLEDADESVMEAYVRHANAIGLDMPLLPGNNDVESGVQRLNWMLRERLLSINPWNTEGIEELETVEYGDNGKVKALQADHFMDSLRVGLMAIDFTIDEIYEELKQETLVDQILRTADNAEFDLDMVYGSRYRTTEEPI